MVETPPEEPPNPEDIAPEDRFFLNGRARPFRDFVTACMTTLAPREKTAPVPQPAPESLETIWSHRRPIEP